MIEPPTPHIDRFVVEFVLRLFESDLFTHVNTTHEEEDGDAWLIEFEWKDQPHQAELDLEAGNLLLDWRSESIRVEVSEDGYSVGDSVYSTAEAAAQALVDTLEKRAADLGESG